MAGRKINWIAVRTAYVVRGLSAQQCADEFRINVTTVKKKASDEGWTSERHRHMTDATMVVAERIGAAQDEQLAIHAERTKLDLELSDALRDKIRTAIKAVDPKNLQALRSVTETHARFSESRAKLFTNDRLVRGLAGDTPSDGAQGDGKSEPFVFVDAKDDEPESGVG